MTEDEDFADSGPFCIHWDDGLCNEKCATCGHTCSQHGGGYLECSEQGCDCKKFEAAAIRQGGAG